MSFSAQHFARSIRTGSPTLKAVLMALANFCDDDGYCWPSQLKLAEQTELSERAVRNALASLEEMGLIVRQARKTAEGKHTSDLIRVILEPAARDAGGSENQRHDIPEPQAPGSKTTGTSFQNHRHEVPPNLSIEPPIESPREETRVREAQPASSPSSVSEAFEQFWKGYPQKVGKGAAQASFVRAMKSKKVDFQTLMAGLESYRNKKDDRPWCNPATWLNQQRWLDEPIAGNDPKKPVPVRRVAI